MTVDWTWLELWVLLLLWGCLYFYLQYDWLWDSAPVESQVRSERTLKAASPAQCDVCQSEAQPHASAPMALPSVPPWSEYKSQRGRRKQIDSEGYACDNSACPFFGITEARIHALRGDGSSTSNQFIQSSRCGACGRTFTSRRHTPLYRTQTSVERIVTVLAALAEGLFMKAAVRVFGHAQGTITTWLTHSGQHAILLHEHTVQQLHCLHLQLDELHTTLREGARTQQMAYALVHALVRTLAPECLPLFTTDGLDFYFYALTAHFGSWVQEPNKRKRIWQVCAQLIYGQVKKHVRRRRLLKTEPRMRCGTLEQLTTQLRLLGYSGIRNTAFVERLNFTVR